MLQYFSLGFLAEEQPSLVIQLLTLHVITHAFVDLC